MSEFEEKENYLKTVFEHNIKLIELVDNKTNILLGIISVLIPVIFGINVYFSTQQTSRVINLILSISFIISSIILVIAVIFSILVIKARLEDKYEDNIFFKNIRKKGLLDYQEYIKDLTRNKITDDFTKEIYTLAEINSKKYKNYRKALYFLIAGVLLLILGYLASVITNLSL